MENKVLIIAEAGVNHNGSLDKAFKLIDAAVDAGVDLIKFQTFKAENLVSKSAKKADYQVANTKDAASSQFEMLKKLELNEDDHHEILNYCKKRNIQFFSTAFDLESLLYLKEIGLKLVKIPSGEITNLPYLRLAAKLFDRAIISTGMATMDEIKAAINVFKNEGKADISVLHCNTEYPTPMEDVNLKAMLTIRDTFEVNVGYSDHTLGIEVPVAAVALGACIIEKHFTLDKSLPGPDHAASLDPNELKEMVKAIRNIEKAVSGTGIKEPSPSELKNIQVARKSIVARTLIEEGEVFDEGNITVKRPGLGLSPMLWDEVVGQRASRSYNPDDLIEL